MKAVAISRFGGPDVIEEVELTRPVAGPGQLLVKVHACGCNPVDFKIREGLLPVEPGFPLVLGYDVSGVVEGVGGDDTVFEVGDEVYYSPELGARGAYAEYHVVDASIVALKPVGLTHERAASLPLSGLTAWQALFERVGASHDDVVLIHGGAGGVGSLAVQLAAWAGCEVIATASAGNLEFVETLGASLVLDYNVGNFVPAVLEATAGEGADVVFDTVGGGVFTRSIDVLAPHGRLVTIVPGGSRKGLSEAVRKAFQKNAEVHFYCMERDRYALDAIARLVERSFIEPVVDEVIKLTAASIRRAHGRRASGHGRGKIVISMDGA